MQPFRAITRTTQSLRTHSHASRSLRVFISPTSAAPAQGPYTAQTYARKADHTANTAHPSTEESYILTLHTTAAHHALITALRSKYFPAHLNKLSAHIALFRALPGSHLPTITTDLASLTQYETPFRIATTEAFALGKDKGVALGVDAPEAGRLYEWLREEWVGFLSAQDKSFRPHYTLQNKVDEGTARRSLEEVRESFEGSEGVVDGLVLWRYERGHWRHVRDFHFGEG